MLQSAHVQLTHQAFFTLGGDACAMQSRTRTQTLIRTTTFDYVRDWQNGAKVLLVKYCVPIRDRERWRVGIEVAGTGSTAR